MEGRKVGGLIRCFARRRSVPKKAGLLLEKKICWYSPRKEGVLLGEVGEGEQVGVSHRVPPPKGRRPFGANGPF